MLTYAKERYINDNVDLIAEERKRKRLEEIRKANLV
jgi:hypothetical protein